MLTTDKLSFDALNMPSGHPQQHPPPSQFQLESTQVRPNHSALTIEGNDNYGFSVAEGAATESVSATGHGGAITIVAQDYYDGAMRQLGGTGLLNSAIQKAKTPLALGLAYQNSDYAFPSESMHHKILQTNL